MDARYLVPFLGRGVSTSGKPRVCKVCGWRIGTDGERAKPNDESPRVFFIIVRERGFPGRLRRADTGAASADDGMLARFGLPCGGGRASWDMWGPMHVKPCISRFPMQCGAGNPGYAGSEAARLGFPHTACRANRDMREVARNLNARCMRLCTRFQLFSKTPSGLKFATWAFAKWPVADARDFNFLAWFHQNLV